MAEQTKKKNNKNKNRKIWKYKWKYIGKQKKAILAIDINIAQSAKRKKSSKSYISTTIKSVTLQTTASKIQKTSVCFANLDGSN